MATLYLIVFFSDTIFRCIKYKIKMYVFITFTLIKLQRNGTRKSLVDWQLKYYELKYFESSKTELKVIGADTAVYDLNLSNRFICEQHIYLRQ